MKMSVLVRCHHFVFLLCWWDKNSQTKQELLDASRLSFDAEINKPEETNLNGQHLVSPLTGRTNMNLIGLSVNGNAGVLPVKGF